MFASSIITVCNVWIQNYWLPVLWAAPTICGGLWLRLFLGVRTNNWRYDLINGLLWSHKHRRIMLILVTFSVIGSWLRSVQHWIDRPLELWILGSVDRWSVGLVGRRSVGLLDRWGVGLVDHWSVGSVDHWSIGSVDRWSVGLVDHWSVGSVDRWSIGSVDRWTVGSEKGEFFQTAVYVSMCCGINLVKDFGNNLKCKIRSLSYYWISNLSNHLRREFVYCADVVHSARTDWILPSIRENKRGSNYCNCSCSYLVATNGIQSFTR